MYRQMDDLRKVPQEQGRAREFSAPYARILAAAQQGMVDAGLTIKETDSTGHTKTIAYAERGITALSWGELVRVIVEAVSLNTTSVKVVTLRRLALNLTAKGDFSKDIFANMVKMLNVS